MCRHGDNHDARRCKTHRWAAHFPQGVYCVPSWEAESADRAVPRRVVCPCRLNVLSLGRMMLMYYSYEKTLNRNACDAARASGGHVAA